MIKIKKLLLVILATFLISSCESNETRLLNQYKNEIDEIDALFAAPCVDATLSTETPIKTQEVINLFKDSECIKISYSKSYSENYEMYSKDKAFLCGDKYKVKISSNNSALFSKTNDFSIRDYIKEVDPVSTSNSLLLNLDGQKLYSASIDSIIMSTFVEALKSSKINPPTLPLEVTFKDNKITRIDFVLDSNYINGGELVKYRSRLFYKVNYYSKEEKTYPNDFNDPSYLEVDYPTFLLVRESIEAYVTNGRGLTCKANEEAYYFNVTPQDDDVIAYLYLNNDIKREVRYKEVQLITTLSGEFRFSYTFAGKSFSFSVRRANIDCILPSEQFQFSTTYKTGDLLYEDNDLDRVFMLEGNSLIMLSELTLETRKIFELENFTINRIQRFDDVYHITIDNKDYIPRKNPELLEGYIYIYDVHHFEEKEVIKLDFAPYYTNVDKRGNIGITNKYSSNYTLHIFYKETSEIKSLSIGETNRGKSYVDYDSERDAFITNCTEAGGINPRFFLYESEEYIYREDYSYKQSYSFGLVHFKFGDYLSTESGVFNVSDWTKVVGFNISDSTYCGKLLFTFSSNQNTIYYFSKGLSSAESYYSVLTQATFNDGKLTTTRYNLNGNAENYAFGFAYGGGICLYNKVNDTIDKFILRKTTPYTGY